LERNNEMTEDDRARECREAFEAWYGGEGCKSLEKNNDGQYFLMQTHLSWSGFKAGWFSHAAIAQPAREAEPVAYRAVSKTSGATLSWCDKKEPLEADQRAGYFSSQVEIIPREAVDLDELRMEVIAALPWDNLTIGAAIKYLAASGYLRQPDKQDSSGNYGAGCSPSKQGDEPKGSPERRTDAELIEEMAEALREYARQEQLDGWFTTDAHKAIAKYDLWKIRVWLYD